MNKPKVAVVGCGYWGKNLVRNFSEMGVLQSVCDPNVEQAEAYSKKYNVSQLSFEETLSSEVDGVVIAAPAEQHYTLAKAALLAKKHVFVEKPISLSINEAEELCELSRAQDKILMVGHLLQYHPAFVMLKKMTQEGKLGKLQYIYSNRLNLGKFRNEENIMWSFAPHDISMILSLAGSLPTSVLSTGAAHLNPHIHDVTTTHMSFHNGLQSHVFVSWLHPFKEQKLVVVGEKGMVVFDDGHSWDEKLKLYPHKVNWINGFPQPQKAEYEAISLEENEPLRMECQHFIKCIETNTKARTDGYEGLDVLKVLDASQESLMSRKEVLLGANGNSQLTYFVHDTACVDSGCEIGKKTKIWHYSHILKGTKMGENCIVGQNVMIGPDVTIGDDCKIQNNVS